MDYLNFGIIIAISVFSGFSIGYNRRCKGAGVRDFAIIILGISLTTFTLIRAFPESTNVYGGLSNLIVAIGFITTGILFNQQKQVMGVTTGLAIFISSVIGIMYGLQNYIYGGILTIATIIILMLNKVHKTCTWMQQ